MELNRCPIWSFYVGHAAAVFTLSQVKYAVDRMVGFTRTVNWWMDCVLWKNPRYYVSSLADWRRFQIGRTN